MRALGAIRICGLLLPLNEGTSKDCPALKDTWSVYDVETNAVWLDENTPEDHRPLWTVHEALHGIFDTSGVSHTIAYAMGLAADDPKVEEVAEIIIRNLSRHVLETFGPPTILAQAAA